MNLSDSPITERSVRAQKGRGSALLRSNKVGAMKLIDLYKQSC
jgi:hypothetical protein